MYLDFYGLRRFPFAMGCDESFFYESSVHAEALANMLYTFQQRKGMVLITGEVGAGKTFVGNVLMSRLGPGCQSVMLKNPPQSGKQVVRALASRFGITAPPSADKLSLVDRLEQHLIRMHSRGRLAAIIIDECQDLGAASLEEVRLLWNLEQDGQRLLQILLIGQPELREMIQQPRWESLRQRIVLSYHLAHLTFEDAAAYVAHRLKVAGDGDGSLLSFQPETIADIYAATDGIPRLINVLCDNALLVGYARAVHCIDPSIVAEVLRDMTCWGLRTPVRPLQADPSGALK